MRDDLRLAVRSLLRSPAFTIVALVVLSLGIGASTAIFSVVDAVFLRGLPFDEYDRLVAVLEHDTKRDTTFGSGRTTIQTFLDWRDEKKVFDSLCAVANVRLRHVNDRGEPDDLGGQRVTWEFFRTLRVALILGRMFGPEDEIWGRHRVLLLTYGAWQRRFGGSPDAIGKTIDLDEQRWQVIGVLPADFSYPVGSAAPAEVFVPLGLPDAERSRESRGRNYNWIAIGRLKKGVSAPQAQEQMNVVAAALDQQYPKWAPGRRVRVEQLHNHLVGRVRAWMLLLLGAVGLVQLIACANVANLMLARATTRAREMAIRAAMGAGRARLMRSLLVESVLLALCGAAIGILLASYGVDVLRAWIPANVPRVADIALDLRVLGTAIAAALVTGILFGIVPAFRASRVDLVTALKEGTRAAAISAGGQRLRNAVVIAEVALALPLLLGAALFIASFVRLVGIDPGFDYRNILVVSVGVRMQGGDVKDALRRGGPYVARMMEAVGAVPGVHSIAAVSGGMPLSGGWSRVPVTLPGRGELPGDGMSADDNSIDKRTVTPNYFQVLRIPLRRGRYLNDHDRAGSERVVVINEAAARRYWPGVEPLGKRITFENVERVVVGIVGDIRHLGPETPPRQEGYIAFAQEQVISMTVAMRTIGDPLKVFPAVKSAIWSVNPEQRIFTETVTLGGHMDRLISQRRFNMALLGLLGLLALVIAAAGIYGVMAYLVAQRTGEIGVRMALGATPANILAMVLRRACLLIATGLVIGGVASWYLSAGVRAFLFQIEPNDPIIFATAIATLSLAGLIASVVPARRAAKVDPVVALRQE